MILLLILIKPLKLINKDLLLDDLEHFQSKKYFNSTFSHCQQDAKWLVVHSAFHLYCAAEKKKIDDLNRVIILERRELAMKDVNDSFMRTTIHKTLWIDQLIYFADSDTVSFPEKAFPMAITHVVVSWKTQIIKNLERN